MRTSLLQPAGALIHSSSTVTSASLCRLQRTFSAAKNVFAPLDINDFRQGRGGDIGKLHELQQKRYKDPGLINKVVELDNKWRDAVFKVESLKRDFNAHNQEIGRLRKTGKDTSKLQQSSGGMKLDIEHAVTEMKGVLELRDVTLASIGNYVHDSVPDSNDEADNEIMRSWGVPRRDCRLLNHVDIMERLGILDQHNGIAVAGNRGYYLKGAGLFLNQALIQHGLHFAYSRGYEPIMTPFFMRQSVMAACSQLSQFDDELYKVTGEGEDKYLIATSEQPLCALHMEQWFDEKELPRKFVGYSSSFRKEAGSHGKDMAGLYRVHQFEKVEQFVVTSPLEGASWYAFDEMIQNAEDFYKSLDIPHRISNIVSGALNDAAAKKYDLEAWFPASGVYRELVSCSNCLDYQARALKARLRTSSPNPQDKQSRFVHMLNCTLTATGRTLCCILENHQTKEGIRVPEALRPYMPRNLNFISFK